MTNPVWRRRRTVLMLALSVPLACTPAHATPSAAEQNTIERLIRRISGKRTMVFIRNGSEHDAADAAQHMQAKFEHFRERIVTAEDFIALCATRSEVTGQRYKVREGGGPLRDAGGFMTEELRLVRQEIRRAGPGKTTQ